MEMRQGGDLSLEKRVAPVAACARIPTDALMRGDGPEEESDTLSMPFLQHLEELRTRIIRALMGLVITFMFCIAFCYRLWDFVQAPATEALKKIGADPPVLVINQPMEFFSIVWVQVPMVFSLFLASPWVLYQVWAFISPGLYRREKRLAVPFVLSTAGLFILGGLFAYFVAFRFGLTFLLGLALAGGVKPLVTITTYFDLFFDVMLGVSLVFELPVAIFFLTLLHIASPKFLLRHSDYAILVIVILAAIITPTPDFFNLTLVAVPICLLYFVGVFASYLLILKREGRRIPWGKIVLSLIVSLLLIAAVSYWRLLKIGYHPTNHLPFMVR